MCDGTVLLNTKKVKYTMRMILCVAPLLYLLSSFASAILPVKIPKYEPGTRYDPNSMGALVKLEVFLDLNCPDSLTAWLELKKVGEQYSSDKLDLVVHHFPLPYHDNAFMCSQGFYLIRDFLGEKAALTYLEEILKSWYTYSPRNTENKTKLAVKRMLAEKAAAVTPIDREQFFNYLDHYRGAVVEEWKYGARRSVAGTPWYFVNGVDLTVNTALSSSDLQKLLNSLIT